MSSNNTPVSGLIIGADNQAHNIVDILGGGTPVNNKIYDISQYPPVPGLVIGNDCRLYDLSELLKPRKGEKGDPGEKGDKGDPGAVSSMTIGTVQTGAAGTSADVSITGTTENPVLNFTIPRGAKGDTGTGALNTNMLDNWDFRNPVNQRNVSEFTLNKYGIDRWLLNTGACSINDGYLTLGTGSAIVQKFETWELDGQQVCLSVMLADGTIKSGTILPSASENKSIVVDDIRLGLYNGALNKYFQITRLSESSSINIAAAKVEIGSNSTLAKDAPANFGEEMLKCQRYCQTISQVCAQPCITISQNSVQAIFPLGIRMRANPSITAADDAFAVYLVNSGVKAEGFTMSSDVRRPDYIRIVGNKSGHGLTNASIRALTNVVLYADL